MTSIVKSQIIKDFKQKISSLNTFFMKVCSGRSHFQTQDREALQEAFKDHTNHYMFHSENNFDYLLGNHFFSFHEMRDYSVAFGLMFPSNFSEYENIEDGVRISIDLQDKYDRNNESQMTYISLCEFNDFIDCFVYFSKFSKDNHVFVNQNESQHTGKKEEFKKLFFQDHQKVTAFVKRFKSNEELYVEMLAKKHEWASKKRAINKERKDNKKQNKGQVNSKIKDNESTIRALQRQIRDLENENKRLKRGDMNGDENKNKQIVDTLYQRYITQSQEMLLREVKLKTNTNFNHVFRSLFN